MGSVARVGGCVGEEGASGGCATAGGCVTTGSDDSDVVATVCSTTVVTVCLTVSTFLTGVAWTEDVVASKCCVADASCRAGGRRGGKRKRLPGGVAVRITGEARAASSLVVGGRGKDRAAERGRPLAGVETGVEMGVRKAESAKFLGSMSVPKPVGGLVSCSKLLLLLLLLLLLAGGSGG